MATREEIREWINKYLTKRFISSDCPDDECLREANAILTYLDSQDIVRKVGGRLPRCGYMGLSAVHGVTNPVCPLAKAGCGFVEPLIKE